MLSFRPEGVAQLYEGLAAGVTALAEAIAVEARRDAPVGTGELRDSINVEVTLGALGEVVAIVHATSPHALFVEVGTVNMPAEPYMTPALLAGQARAPEIIGAGMRTKL